ncbi:cupin domain-containing protein [Arthrobacter pascens]|jgi:transcriptional regulator with XRE-family HTH domain|uniref:cupin domain-containing protein n=1 Tax=Arthrobacter pascens TaxID=1677 RepID=UPI00196B7606|nr:cupin domain-containing protein [Arthrobacter pascens]MBN3496139.1 cupin domain-containing protein [Arthrobacter pascens]MDR6559881.1 transcriptional regulator with XRE-family HTH domain [Arthrobacter pascens]
MSETSEMQEDAGSEVQIGERLRELRNQYQYSIRGLASRAGVSASLVSDIEKGKVEPSISTLKRMATALGTNITYFFSEPTLDKGRVVRAGERTPIGPASYMGGRSGMESRGIRFELASPAESEAIEAIYGRYEVGASTGDEPYTHEGEEWGMVLTGRLKVVLEDQVYFLDPGDSIWFPSTIPHRMENVASTVTEYIWIDTPKSF